MPIQGESKGCTSRWEKDNDYNMYIINNYELRVNNKSYFGEWESQRTIIVVHKPHRKRDHGVEDHK